MGRQLHTAFRPLVPGSITKNTEQRAEAKFPEKAADYIMERAIDPLQPVTERARQVGLPESTARALEARLQNEYAGLVEEVELVTQDVLERRLSRRLNAADKFLTNDRLQQLFEGSKLKDLSITEAVWIDKLIASRSTPIAQVTPKEQQSLDQVLVTIMEVAKSRGIDVTATQNKLELSTK